MPTTNDLKLCPKCGERQGWFCSIYVGLMSDTKEYPSYSRYMCAACRHKWQELIPREPIDPNEPMYTPVPVEQFAKDCLYVAAHHPNHANREMAAMGAMYFGLKARQKKMKDKSPDAVEWIDAHMSGLYDILAVDGFKREFKGKSCKEMWLQTTDVLFLIAITLELKTAKNYNVAREWYRSQVAGGTVPTADEFRNKCAELGCYGRRRARTKAMKLCVRCVGSGKSYVDTVRGPLSITCPNCRGAGMTPEKKNGNV